MFVLATLIGIYGNLILLLGIAGLLYSSWVLGVTVGFLLFCTIYTRYKTAYLNRSWFLKTIKQIKNILKSKSNIFLILLLLLLVLVNFVGVLGPEISFDALWYHLTLPKLFLSYHRIMHISGNLFYYSDMPKFSEMLYIPTLLIKNEVGAKLIHFTFGILTLVVIFKISTKITSTKFAILAVAIFYSNLVVDWLSITSYIDLTRTFFESMSLLGLLNYIINFKRKWLIESAVMLGLAISTKLIALESIVTCTILIMLVPKISFKKRISGGVIFILIALLVPLPWFVQSFLSTGNPIYPFFSSLYTVGTSFHRIPLASLLRGVWTVNVASADPISPLYILIFPLIFAVFKDLKRETRYLAMYSSISFAVWFITSQAGGTRFLVPYLPAASVVCVGIIQKLRNRTLQTYLTSLIFFLLFVSIGYRSLANKKYLPYIFHKETKKQFLTQNLNFSFGDFYDIDGFFSRNIKPSDTVLLYGFHNLYYVNFTFIDSSFVKRGDRFDYIAVQNSHLPERFENWNEIYANSKTRVRLYKFGGNTWIY